MKNSGIAMKSEPKNGSAGSSRSLEAVLSTVPDRVGLCPTAKKLQRCNVV